MPPALFGLSCQQFFQDQFWWKTTGWRLSDNLYTWLRVYKNAGCNTLFVASSRRTVTNTLLGALFVVFLHIGTTDNYSMCFCLAFLNDCTVRSKYKIKFPVRISRLCAFGNKIVTSHRVRVNSGNSGSFK